MKYIKKLFKKKRSKYIGIIVLGKNNELYYKKDFISHINFNDNKRIIIISTRNCNSEITGLNEEEYIKLKTNIKNELNIKGDK